MYEELRHWGNTIRSSCLFAGMLKVNRLNPLADSKMVSYFYLSISCHWSLSIPLENIRKALVFCRKGPVAWNRLHVS